MKNPPQQAERPDRLPRWPVALAAGAYAAWCLYLAVLMVLQRVS